MRPFISICIPAYKNVAFLKRLLDSITLQNFLDYEVIVSDDSPNNDVEILLENYKNKFPALFYFKNNPPLGMPRNWNAALEKCAGEWLKIMHDDDWFVNEYSLRRFADAAVSKIPFIFCNYNNVLESGPVITKTYAKRFNNKLLKDPAILVADNIIGPPSVCLVHNSLKILYNNGFTWFVDIEYYMHCLKSAGKIQHINKPLINIGLSEQQVTKAVKNNPAIEFPEAFKLLALYGIKSLNNLIVYDAWWRMCRNMKVRSVEELAGFLGLKNGVLKDKLPGRILAIIKYQKLFSTKVLKFGPFSKILMFLSFIFN